MNGLTTSIKIITVDFETYFDADYNLKKLTTEEYVRDDRFEIVGIAVKVENESPQWFSGPHLEIKKWLMQFDLYKNILLAHNTVFDGFILSHHFNMFPLKYADTMAMGKILHGVDESVSLENLSTIYYGQSLKGDYVKKVSGIHRTSFSEKEMEEYGEYCIGDVNLTWMLFNLMIPKLPIEELNLIDLTNKMYCKPTICIDSVLLTTHLSKLKAVKQELLEAAEVNKETVMSGDKFATMLRLHGVSPPKKISPITGKEAWAFAKTDVGFKELMAHENPKVQLLAAARLGNKSTLDETRTARFLGIASRSPGTFPFSVSYAGAAITHRWSGFDVNPQNLPRGGMLRKGLIAPPDHLLIAGDLNAIELRIGLWLANENGQLELLKQGIDLYKKSAEEINGTPYDQVDKDLRFIFKTVNLAAIYGVGHEKLWATLTQGKVNKSLEEVKYIVTAYRRLRHNLTATWRQGDKVLEAIYNKQTMDFGRDGLIKVVEGGLLKPNGMVLAYPSLNKDVDNQWVYRYLDMNRFKWDHLYGAKVFQRVVQSLARDIIAYQMLLVNKKIPVVGTVHDEIIGLIKIERQEKITENIDFMRRMMAKVPPWAEGLPVHAEIGIAHSYGDIVK